MRFERLENALWEGMHRSIEAVMKSSDNILSYHAVTAGMAAAFLPGWLVDEDLASGRLVRLPGATDFAGTLFAVYASRRQMPLKLRSFVDFLVARLGEAPEASSQAAAKPV